MPNTSRGYPYPAGTVGVPPDVRGDLQSLATAINTDVGSVAGTANAGGTDTAWSLSQVTLSSGWNNLRDPSGNTSSVKGGARKVGGTVNVSFLCDRSGGTISGDGSGNVSPDVQIATLASGYRPGAPRYFSWARPGVSSGQIRIDTSGAVVLTSINNGATLASSTSVQVDATFLVG